jgi:transposase
MTTMSQPHQVIGGVDTHKHTHHGAVVDVATGKLLGDGEFAVSAGGYAALLAWLRGFGEVLKGGGGGHRFLSARA